MRGFGIFLRLLNGGLMVGIPCLAAYFLLRRGRGGFRPIGLGVVGFVLSQVGHIPFNRFVMLPGLERLGVDLAALSGSSLWALGISAGFSAAVFEEVTRWIVFRFWLRGDSGEYTPWKYGVGHGGIEAIFAGLLALYALVQVLVLGGEGALGRFPAEQAELVRSQLEMYWAVPWYQTLLGAWERVSALAFHLGASVFVYKSVRGKKPIWFLVAILGHALLDAFAVIAIKGMDLVLLELLIFIFAAAWLFWAWRVRPLEAAPGKLDFPSPPEPTLPVPQITTEQLEESRYD